MSEQPQEWRVGTHFSIHVYEGETPVCTALTAEFAAQIVADHNRATLEEGRATGATSARAEVAEEIAQALKRRRDEVRADGQRGWPLLTEAAVLAREIGSGGERPWPADAYPEHMASAPAVPQPVDREALELVLHDHYYDAGWSREHQGFRCVCGWLGDDHVQHAAEQVLALLSTSGEVK